MKLEYGKRYVVGDGFITTQMQKSGMVTHPFRANVPGFASGSLTWTEDGEQGTPDTKIVSEYCESVSEESAPEVIPEPRKLVWVPGRTYKMRNGGLVFIILVDEGQSYPVTGFRIYPGEDAEQFPNTWTIEGKRHMGNVESSFDIVDYAYEVGDDE